MGAKHTHAALADRQVCAHCSTMPVKILERRLREAVTGTDGKDLSVAASDTAQESHATHQQQAPRAWVDLMEEVEPIPPLFEGVFRREGDDADDEIGSDIFKLGDMEDGEEDSTFLTQSRPLSQPKQLLQAGAVEPSLTYHLHPSRRSITSLRKSPCPVKWRVQQRVCISVCTNMLRSHSADLAPSRCCWLIKRRFWRRWAVSWIQGSRTRCCETRSVWRTISFCAPAGLWACHEPGSHGRKGSVALPVRTG